MSSQHAQDLLFTIHFNTLIRIQTCFASMGNICSTRKRQNRKFDLKQFGMTDRFLSY